MPTDTATKTLVPAEITTPSSVEAGIGTLEFTDGFTHVADIMIGSFYDAALEAGCAFEELISFHGGIGGFQTRPFILHPTVLELPPGPILGAATVHGILAGWRRQLAGGGGASDAAHDGTPVTGTVEQPVGHTT